MGDQFVSDYVRTELISKRTDVDLFHIPQMLNPPLAKISPAPKSKHIDAIEAVRIGSSFPTIR